jgi:hypothetical protein
LKWVGTRKGLIIFIWKEVRGMEIERIQERIDALMGYREALDGSERELFDALIGYANEVALSIDRGSAAGAY